MSPDSYGSLETVCKLAMTVQVFAIVGDFLCIFLITMDRYLYINIPLRYADVVTKKRVYAVICSTFILAAPFAIIKVWIPNR